MNRATKFLLVGAIAALAGGFAACQPTDPYDVAVFGDLPYTSDEVAPYNQMIAAINSTSIFSSTHVGDIGRDNPDPCLSSTVDTETNRMDTFRRPLVFTPGDNEWADCSDDVARLEYIRHRVHRGTGTLSRGETTMPLTSQDARGYPENARFRKGPVTFVTIHVVGSKDNGTGSTGFAARRQANIDWLRDAFATAESNGDKAVVIMAQDHPNIDNKASSSGAQAYQSMRDAVVREVSGFAGEVLYIHGDGHSFKNVTGELGLSNLQRVQVEGDTKVSYVRVHVEPGGSNVVSVSAPVTF